MSLPNYKEIMSLIKKGATLEAQEKIVELRETALDLQDQNLNLREQIIDLNKQLKKLVEAEGDPCPKCRKLGWGIKSSKKHPVFHEVGAILRVYECSVCGFSEEKMITP